MARVRFVSPDVVRLPLSDGDFLDVKRELNAGEQRHIFARHVKEMRLGEAARLDPEKVGLAKLQEYIVGWSFADANGKPVEVSEDAINSLDGESYRECVEAVDAHELSVDVAREARKNSPATSNESAAT